MSFWPRLVAAAALAGFAFSPSVAEANDRHFTYTYETAVLPPGARELEAVDHLACRPRAATTRASTIAWSWRWAWRTTLMTSLYINFTGLTEEDNAGMRTSEFEYEGVSNEWKLKLSDPVADAVGFGLYGEVTAAPSEYEAEAKLLLDKQLGDVLIAFNAVGESEWEVGEDETENELVPATRVGRGLPGESQLLGGRRNPERKRDRGRRAGPFRLSAGPVISYSTETWWTALTFMPQITDFKQGEVDKWATNGSKSACCCRPTYDDEDATHHLHSGRGAARGRAAVRCRSRPAPTLRGPASAGRARPSGTWSEGANCSCSAARVATRCRDRSSTGQPNGHESWRK